MSCWNLFFISSLYTHTHTHTHLWLQYEEQVIADLIADSCVLPSEPERVADPWPTPGNAALGVGGFFRLVIDDFVVSIWINGSFCTSLSSCLAQTSRLIKHAYFRCQGSEFQFPWLVEYQDMPVWSASLESLRFWDFTKLSWTLALRMSHYSSPPEKRHNLCGLRWRKTQEVPLSLAVFHQCSTFPLLFWLCVHCCKKPYSIICYWVWWVFLEHHWTWSNYDNIKTSYY